jgi:hypothetical protein
VITIFKHEIFRTLTTAEVNLQIARIGATEEN